MGIKFAGTDVVVSGQPRGVALADIDRDGDLDLVTTIYDSPGKVSVQLNDGQGGFSPGTDYAMGSFPAPAAVADFNGDGRLDLATSNSTAGSMTVRLADGQGGFAAEQSYAVGAGGLDIAAVDINRDGKLDLVTANDAGGTVSVRINDGAGGFGGSADAKTYSVGANPQSIAVGDIDRNGKPDLVVALANSDGKVSVLLADNQGGFSISSAVDAGTTPGCVALADLNRDGKLDLVTGNGNGTVSVRIGDGLGGFAASAYTAVGPDPRDIAVADVNRDGRLDLVVANGGGSTLSVLLGDGAGGFSGKVEVGVGSGPRTVAVADVNGDGVPDLLAANFNGNTVSVRLGSEVAVATGIAASGPAGTGLLKIGDVINFTLTTDIPVTTTGEPRLTLSNGATAYLNGQSGVAYTFTYVVKEGDTDIGDLKVTGLDTSSGTLNGRAAAMSFEAATTVITGVSGQITPSATLVDIDRDGDLDLLAGREASGFFTLNRGMADGSFGSASAISTGFSPRVLAAGDIDRDGDLDVVAANYGSNTVSVRLNNGTGGFTSGADVTVGIQPSAVTLADVNRDGKLDMLVANSDAAAANGTVSVRLGDGAGGFTGTTNLAVGKEPVALQVADMNRDGKLDLLVVNKGSGSSSVSIFNNSGNTTTPFQSGAATNVNVSGTPVLACDVDGDGKLDLVTSSSIDGRVLVRLANNAGGFTPEGNVGVGGVPTALAAADFNGDGKLDLAVATSSANGVRILTGDGTGNFASGPFIATSAAPASVAVADVNRDGRPDLAISSGSTVSIVRNTSIAAAPFDPGSLATAPGAATGRAVDATRPATVTARLAADTGTSSTDGITNNAALTILNQESGATLSYQVDDDPARLSSFDWTTLSDGSHSVKILQTDLAGNESAAGTVNFTLDRVAPTAPVVSLASDTGSFATDRVTNDARLSLNDLEAGARRLYFLISDSGFASFGDFTGGSSPYDASKLPDGSYELSIANFDAAGNSAELANRVFYFTLDRTAAAAPVLSLRSDTGSSATDKITKDATLAFAGVEDGAALSFVVDGNSVGANYDPTKLGDGAHTVSLTQTDKAGNVAAAATVSFTLDRVAPTAPVVSLTSDTGSSATDGVTNDARLSISDLETGGTRYCYLYFNSNIISSREFSGDKLPYELSELADGSYSAGIYDFDKAGNVTGPANGNLLFTLDRTAAAAPVLSLRSDTGSSTTDKITNDAALAVAGVEDGAVLSYVVDGNGVGAAYDPAALGEGAHTVTVTQSDAAGNVSAAGTISFTLDRTAAAAPVLALSSDTGASATDGVTGNAALTLSGIEAGAALSFVVDGGAPSATYDPSTLGQGAHTVTLIQTDAAGNASAAGTIGFTLDGVAPSAGGLALAADTGASGSDKVTSDARLSPIGAEAGVTVVYAVDGKAAGSYDPAALSEGRHTVVATQTDAAGNASTLGSLTFTLDTRGPAVSGVSVSGPDVAKGTGTLTTGERAVFTLALDEAVTRAADAAAVTLTLSNGASARYLASASDAKHLAFAYTVKLEDTAADLAVTAVKLNGAAPKDAAGNAASLSGAVRNPAGTLKIDGLTGTGGADSFKGKSGAQTFKGLGGDDGYTVDNRQDRIVELAKGGTDRVASSISFALSANVENLTLTGKAKINATGNELGNALSGNAAANTLSGLAGNDTLKGFAGNDRLLGGAGADKLFGGDGKTGLGADAFVFTKLSESTASTEGRDTIFDFGADDRIDLSAIDTSTKTKGDQGFTWIGTDKFHGKAGELRFDKAKSDTFITADVNGDKKADFAIHLDDAVSLTKAMFVL